MNKFIPIIISGLIFGGVGFYGGYQYGQSKATPNFGNLSPDQRRQMFRDQGANIGGFRNSQGRNNGGFASGEILSKDDKSLTLKLRDSGSKIIFFSDTMEISKNAEGAVSDLEIGKNVTVMGIPNQDGSITANSIQLRPENLPTSAPPDNQQPPQQ